MPARSDPLQSLLNDHVYFLLPKFLILVTHATHRRYRGHLFLVRVFRLIAQDENSLANTRTHESITQSNRQ
jgi:hypothetical protein